MAQSLVVASIFGMGGSQPGGHVMGRPPMMCR